MARVKRSLISHKRKKRIFEKAKGFYGRAKNCYAIAKQQVERAMQYNYRDRKNRKREFRVLWIQRINAGLREINPEMKYSIFIHLLNNSGIDLDRKVLANLAYEDPNAFKAITDQVIEAGRYNIENKLKNINVELSSLSISQ